MFGVFQLVRIPPARDVEEPGVHDKKHTGNRRQCGEHVDGRGHIVFHDVHRCRGVSEEAETGCQEGHHGRRLLSLRSECLRCQCRDDIREHEGGNDNRQADRRPSERPLGFI